MKEIQKRQAEKKELGDTVDNDTNNKKNLKEKITDVEDGPTLATQADKVLELKRQESIIKQTIQTHQEKLQTAIQNEYKRCAKEKLEIPSHYFKYKKLNFPGTQQVVPDYYIKYVEPTNNEKQNTDEKCWSFKEKMYECTQ